MRDLSIVRALAFACLGLCLGAVVLGHGLLVPMLRTATLVDPNLARALAGPLALRSADLLLAAAVLATMSMRRALPDPPIARVASALALVLTAIAAVERVIVLPKLHHAISQVDLVARRPSNVIVVVEGLERVHQGLLVGAAVAIVGLLVCASHRPALPKVMPADERAP